MELSINKFAGKIYLTLANGWNSDKVIDYELCNKNLVYVTYRTIKRFKSFVLTDILQIAKHLNKIERQYNIIFNLEDV